MTYIIVGLGNPGREYRETRHNVGFLVVDRISERMGIPISKMRSKALIGKGVFNGEQIILAKPQTFMNLSGQAISGLVNFFKVPLDNILIAHDDLDLPFGTIRIRKFGGAGGQKGLGSTIEHLGTDQFPRMRIGIGRPPGRMDAADYVLRKFTGEDLDFARVIFDRAAEAAEVFINEGIDYAMNKYNGTVDDA